MDMFLLTLGLAVMASASSDVVIFNAERKFGWALFYRAQIVLGAFLVAMVLT